MIQDQPARRRRLVLLLSGLALAAAGPWVWARLEPSHRSLIFWLCWGSACVGLGLMLAAALLRPGRLFRLLHWACMNGLVFVSILCLGEAVCRLAHVDFARFQGGGGDPRAAYPLCFHEPDQPLGTVFFKRRGSQSWTGRPLTEILPLYHATDHGYEDEQPFTLTFDRDGFRNDPGLTDWNAVIVGDSFTESGYLPFEQIFSTVAAAKSGLRVKNLATCLTGPFTQMEYLRHFGKSPSCKVAVIGFFEGNDLSDAREEMELMERYKATGERPLREVRAQTSLIKALYQVAKACVHFDLSTRYQNAVFTAAGKELPITLKGRPMPENPATMTSAELALAGKFLDEWKALTTELGMTPVLLYLPCNNRTYDGLVRIEPGAEREIREWKPTSLPAWMRTACEQRGIRFIDACPALRSAAEQGTLVFNPIFDTHFNAEGSRLVGELLGQELRQLTPAGTAP